MLEHQREGFTEAKRDGRNKGRVPTARRQAAEMARLKVGRDQVGSWPRVTPYCSDIIRPTSL
jgi:hypothetical protein